MRRALLLSRALILLTLSLSTLLVPRTVAPAPSYAVFDENAPRNTADLDPTVAGGGSRGPQPVYDPEAGSGVNLELCPHPITQQDIDRSQPYKIGQPGSYCLAEDITVAYQTHGSETILIKADEVTLWFAGHTLQSQSTTDKWEHPISDTAIRIESGYHDILIYDGTIEGFEVGIWADGSRSTPIKGLTIRDMHLEGMTAGINVAGIGRSSIERNSFNACIWGINGHDWTNSVIRDNEITRDSFTPPIILQGLGWRGIEVDRLQGVMIQDNRIVGDDNLTRTPAQYQWGISLYRDTTSDDPVQDRNNLVEANLLIGLDRGIAVFMGGSDNTVRFNRIYGGSPAYVPPANYQAQILSDVGIVVRDEENLIVHDNLVYSGSVKGYEYGFHLRGTVTLGTQPNGLPALYNNETCGVVVPLEPPPGVPQSDVDGGNSWEVCGQTGIN